MNKLYTSFVKISVALIAVSMLMFPAAGAMERDQFASNDTRVEFQTDERDQDRLPTCDPDDSHFDGPDGYAPSPEEVSEYSCGENGCNCWGNDDCAILTDSGLCHGKPLPATRIIQMLAIVTDKTLSHEICTA